MAALVSTVCLVVMPKALMHTHGQRVLFLGVMVLLTLIAADLPGTDESLLDSKHNAMGFLGDSQSPTGSSPLALPNSHYTAFESPDSPGALPSISEPSHEARTADNIYRGSIAYENSKSIMARDASSGEPHMLTTPSLSPSEPLLESSPQFQLFQTQTKSPLQPWENISVTSLSTSAFAKSAAQLGLNSEKNTSFSKQQDGASEKTLANMTLQPEQPLGTPNQTFTDFLADESQIKPMYAGLLSSSNAPLEKNRPTNDIPNLDESLYPGYKLAFTPPHPTSPSPEPTEFSPEYFYSPNDVDVDWGSGDYLETASVFSSVREDYSLVTKLPSDSYDLEDYTESYDTSFPSRVGISPSSLFPLYVSPSPSLMTAYRPIVSSRSIYPSSFSTTVQLSLEPTPTANSDVPDISDIDWPDTYTIQPTDVLLPDMNSLEYYNNQLTKENNSSETGAEHRGNITIVSISTTENTPTNSSSNDTKLTEDDLSGFEPHDGTTSIVTTEESPQLVNASQPFLDPSIVPTHSLYSSSSFWDDQVSTTDWSAHTRNVDLDSTPVTKAVQPSATPLLPDDVIFPSSLTYVHWFVTESFSKSTIDPATVLTPTIEFSPVTTEPNVNSTAATTELTPEVSTFTNEQTLDVTIVSTESGSRNVTEPPPFVMGDQGVTEDGADTLATLTYIPASSEANEVSTAPTSTAATTTPHQATTRIAATSEASTVVTIMSTTGDEITAAAPTTRSYLCNINKPDYLVRIGFPSGATVGYAKSQIGDILNQKFGKLVELQVVDPPPKFVFRVVSGPVVYTAISVVNALQRSGRQFLSLSPNWSTPDRKYQVHSVLQFVPGHIDMRFCNFSENIERGLTMAFTEVRRRSTESTNITVQIVNITIATTTYEKQKLARNPVDITFTVHSSSGYLMGSEISNALMKLTMVEFSYYMGFPVLQIAEPFHYPELNISQLLRSSWVRTVLLGVLDHKVGEKTFQANMERRLAMLLGEAMGSVRRVKRATTVGNSSVQVVSASQLVGDDHPLEIVYFVEGPSGQRIPAVQTANLLNALDVQRAAIVLGHRVQGILAQPVEKVASSPSDNENTNVWIIIGVVIPLLVVIIIISILYWKLCRTDKLEFQPDAMTSIQQRQKSTMSLRESRTSRQQRLPQTKKGIEFSEEEEEEEDEDEEEEEGVEKDFKRGKRSVALLKSKQSKKIEEEEEEEAEEEEEEEEEEDEMEEEEEEEEDKKDKLKNKEIASREQRRQDSKAVRKKPEEVKKEARMKVLSKARRAMEELQAPTVKGFDFAKLHLGQQSKDDVMVIQEPVPPGLGPIPISIKDGLSPSENGEIPTPISKTSAASTKASRSGRKRGRISSSDGDSVLSEHSSERELTEENLRAQATPSDSKQTRKVPINVLNGPPPPMSDTNEQLSSASIFEHVDRMSRATDASKRLPNKVQLIAMQPMPVPPIHSPPINGKLSDTSQMTKEIQVALRHKSEIEHHRNKIRLRAKRKGHYDFPAMDDVISGFGDAKDQDRIYQKEQMQIDKILDPDAQMPSVFMEPKKSGRGRRSPKQRMKDQMNGGMMEADKDHLITEDSDAAYRKCPGVHNVAYVSDPDQGPGSPHRSPSPTDDVFPAPTSSPPGHAPPPPPYMPPQPSIEEARQQMHSLLDDAFALVSPTSQGSTAGITLPGVNSNPPNSSPPGRGPRPWGLSYQVFPSRFTEMGMSSTAVQSMAPRQGLGSSYLPPGETAGHSEQLQPDSLYASRGIYADELPSCARPRPVGGTTGAQLHHLAQVGLSSRMNGYPAGGRAAPGQNGGLGWNHFHDDDFSRAEAEKEAIHRSAIREPTATLTHLDGVGYLTAPPPLDTSPPTHSSASLIKAIREELLRLSQKQAAVPSYHS